MTRSTHAPFAHRLGIVVALCCIGIGVAGCSSDKESSTAATTTTAATSDATFELSEFTLTVKKPEIKSGSAVVLSAHNVGGAEHEIVIIKATSLTGFTLKADGSIDEEAIAEADKRGEIEHVMPGETKSNNFDLEPGTFAVFCNLVDDTTTGFSHFAKGMAAMITVT